jgi:hypothetical protein
MNVKSPGKAAAEARRKQKLAVALKANLKRRKGATQAKDSKNER